MNCTDNIEAPPAVAPSVQDRTACRLFRTWEAEQFYPWLLRSFPKICAALGMADTIVDMTKYKGEYGAPGTPTTLQKGESVSIGNVFYVSKIDNNTDTVPSSSHIRLGGTGIANVTLSSNQSVSTTDEVVVEFDEIVNMDTNLFNLDGNEVEVLTDCIINMSAGIGIYDADDDSVYKIYIRINGEHVAYAPAFNTSSDSSKGAQLTKNVKVNAGDRISMHILSSTDSDYYLRALPSVTYLTIKKG